MLRQEHVTRCTWYSKQRHARLNPYVLMRCESVPTVNKLGLHTCLKQLQTSAEMWMCFLVEQDLDRILVMRINKCLTNQNNEALIVAASTHVVIVDSNRKW